MNIVSDPIINYYKKQLFYYTKNADKNRYMSLKNDYKLPHYYKRRMLIEDLDALSKTTKIYKQKINQDKTLQRLIKTERTRIQKEYKRRLILIQERERKTVSLIIDIAVADLANMKSNYHNKRNINEFILSRKLRLKEIYNNETKKDEMIKYWGNRTYGAMYVNPLKRYLRFMNNRPNKTFTREFVEGMGIDLNNDNINYERALSARDNNWGGVFRTLNKYYEYSDNNN